MSMDIKHKMGKLVRNIESVLDQRTVCCILRNNRYREPISSLLAFIPLFFFLLGTLEIFATFNLLGKNKTSANLPKLK